MDNKKYIFLSEEQKARERAILLELNRDPFESVFDHNKLFLLETGIFSKNSSEYKLLTCNQRKEVYSFLKMSREDIKSLRHMEDYSPSYRYTLIQTMLGLSDLIKIVFENKEFEREYVKRNSKLDNIYESNDVKIYDNYNYPFDIDFSSKIIKHYYLETMSFLPSIRVMEGNNVKYIPLNRLGFNNKELKKLDKCYHKSIYDFININLNKLENSDDFEALKNKLKILDLYSYKYSKNNNYNQSFIPKIKLLKLSNSK